MPLDLEKIGSFLDLGNPRYKAVLDVIDPFLPVLARAGKEVTENFVKHASERNWQRIDAEMYALMTEDERDKLSEQVLVNARAAALEAYENQQAWSQDLFRVVLSVLLSLI